MTNEVQIIDQTPQLPTAAQGESVAAAAARAGAITEMQAFFALARTFPRNLELLRQNLLRECADPDFAHDAVYELPRGAKKIRGASIRFAEGVFRHLENCGLFHSMTADVANAPGAPGHRTWSTRFVDFESRKIWVDEVTIDKTIERHNPGNRVVLTVRENSDGEMVSIVPATDDELRAKENAAKSKSARNLIVKWLDRGIFAEAQARIRETNENHAAENPETARRALIDDFASAGVSITELERFAGQPIATLSPAQVVELGLVATGLRDGACTWHDLLLERGLLPMPDAADETQPTSAGETIMDRLRRRRGQTAAAPAPAAATQPKQDAPVETRKETQKETQKTTPPARDRKSLMGQVSRLLKAETPEDRKKVNAILAEYCERYSARGSLANLTDDQLAAAVDQASAAIKMA